MAGGVLIAAMMVVITIDVVVRNLGYQSLARFFTFTEYALLIVPCLGAPGSYARRGTCTSRSSLRICVCGSARRCAR